MTAQAAVRSNGTIIVAQTGRCYKAAYRRHRHAVRAAKRIAGPIYIYECPRCGTHHLSRQPSRTAPARAY